MRISRPLLAVVVSAGLSGLVVPPASADSTVVVRIYSDMRATHAGFLETSCSKPGKQDLRGAAPKPDVRTGPTPVPSGSRAWSYNLKGTGSAVGAWRRVRSMEDLSFARAQIHASQKSGGTGVLVADVVGNAKSEWHGLARVTIPAGQGWVEVPITGDTIFKWKLRRNSTGEVLDTFKGSTIDMIDHTGKLDAPGYAGVAFGCDSHRFAIDRIEIGDSDDVVTYNLEGALS